MRRWRSSMVQVVLWSVLFWLTVRYVDHAAGFLVFLALMMAGWHALVDTVDLVCGDWLRKVDHVWRAKEE